MKPRIVVVLQNGRLVGVVTNILDLDAVAQDNFKAVDERIDAGEVEDVEVTYDPETADEAFNAS